MSQALLARPAVPSDYAHFVRLFPELATGDPIASQERWEHVLMPETLIFVEGGSAGASPAGGAVVAYAYVQALEGTGYVRHIVVDPSRRGAGVGRAVMEHVAARLREQGCSRWCLNVKPENKPAVELYTRVGMKHAYMMRAFRFPWELLERLPRSDRPLNARIVEPSEDASIEAAFRLPAGQIAWARKKGGLILMRLVDPSAPSEAGLGFASFDQGFPGSFPFRVGHPTLAAPLLEALKPYAPADPPYMQCVVEDDDALAETLIDAGASLRLEAAHMEGSL